MTYKDVYKYVKERIVEGKRMYLFFDEVQRIDGWENAINSLRVEFDTDIYVTGSKPICCQVSTQLTWLEDV